MKFPLRIAAATVAGAIALSATAGAAGASTAAPARRSPMEVVRQACNNKITHRVVVLHDLRERIEHTVRLSPEQKAPMVQSINETIFALETEYRSAVNSADTRAELAEACKSIFVDLRIFAVYVPQVRYTAIIDALANWKDKLTEKVDALHDGGADTTELEALLASAQAKMDDATAKIVSVTPESFNADPAGTRATWDSVHSGLVSAFFDLVQVHQGVNPPPAA